MLSDPVPRGHLLNQLRSRAGLLAFGSSYSPRLLHSHRHVHAGRACEWHRAVFVPDYSGGSTVDLHHLPSETLFVAPSLPPSRNAREICCTACDAKRKVDPVVHWTSTRNRGLFNCQIARGSIATANAGHVRSRVAQALYFSSTKVSSERSVIPGTNRSDMWRFAFGRGDSTDRREA